MSEFDPYHCWLGIPKSEQPANYYRLLGIVSLEDDDEVIRNAVDRQLSHVRKYAEGSHRLEANQILNELCLAQMTLLDPEKRLEYNIALEAMIPEAIVVASGPELQQITATNKELEWSRGLVKTLSTENKSLQENCDALREQLQKGQKILSERGNQIANNRETIAKKKEEHDGAIKAIRTYADNLASRLRDTDEKSVKREQEFSALKKKLAKTQKLAKSLKAELELDAKKTESDQEESALAKERIAKLELQIEALELEGKEKQTELQQTIDALQSSLEKETKLRSQLEVEIADERERYKEKALAEKESSEHEQELATLGSEVSKLKAANQSLLEREEELKRKLAMVEFRDESLLDSSLPAKTKQETRDSPATAALNYGEVDDIFEPNEVRPNGLLKKDPFPQSNELTFSSSANTGGLLDPPIKKQVSSLEINLLERKSRRVLVSTKMEIGARTKFGRLPQNNPRSFAGKLSKDPKLSGAHMEIEFLETLIRVTDLGSKNGTWVQGKELKDSSIEIVMGEIPESEIVVVAGAYFDFQLVWAKIEREDSGAISNIQPHINHSATQKVEPADPNEIW